MGTIYKRGNIYWIGYKLEDGKIKNESSKSTKKAVAKVRISEKGG